MQIIETPDEFQFLPLASIAPSLTNPRKTFRADKLAELAESIKASGVHQPILVRPLPGARTADTDRKVQYEIVAGERRYRASQLVGVSTIPALVRTLLDDQVLEIQITENLQRDDLTELEEAEGYEQLMQHAGITADAVAAKIGKSRSYVYARLKLLDLSHDAREALREGVIDASHALLIARIPDSKLQIKALEQATHTDYQGDVPGVRALQRWVRINVMLRLDTARFKITDALLVPEAGSCKDCPKRTGANPDLFADVDSADVCTDPPCFHRKQEVYSAQQLAAAKASGQKVITEREAKKLWNSPYDSRIDGYIRLDKPDPRLPGNKALKKVLGKDMPEPILLQNPHAGGELIEVLPADKVSKILKDRGLITTSQARAGRAISAHEAEQKVVEKYERTWRKRAILSVHSAMATNGEFGLSTEVVRILAREMIDGLTMDERSLACELFGIGKVVAERAGIEAYIADCDHDVAAEHTLMVLLMLQDLRCFSSWSDGPRSAQRIEAVANDFKIDIADIQADVKAELLAAAKLKKASVATVPAAPPVKGAGGGKLKKAGAPAAPTRKKMSAEEATSGIADAMQDMEQAATARPAPPPDAQPAAGFHKGRRVRVTGDKDLLRLEQLKFAGRIGTITADDGWEIDVTFAGRKGGIAAFVGTQLEVVEVAA